jgi:arsenate reductase
MKTALAFFIISFGVLQAHGQKQKIIFVCEHGAAKSVIATNYFNKLAAERGINYEAVCRATSPDSTLPPATRAGLKADNIPKNQRPRKLAVTDTVNVKCIILFTSLPQDYLTDIPTEDWSGTQNIDASYIQRREIAFKTFRGFRAKTFSISTTLFIVARYSPYHFTPC